MVHLLTKANGVASLLFHVEQSPGTKWQWRWRISGRYPAAYLAWREGESDIPRVVIRPEILGCPVEAQWRESDEDPWSQAALREAAIGTAGFLLQAREDFHAPEGFRVIAVLPGDFIGCYHFEPLSLSAGCETVRIGTADGPFPDNVLLAAGDFVAVDPVLSVRNLTLSSGSLCSPPENTGCLSAIPGSAERRLFARTAERLNHPEPNPS